MSYLLRVVLPDRPGMLGAVATALGEVGGDIVSLDVVERGPDGAVDDLVVAMPTGGLADRLITAAQRVPGVVVESLRPYYGGGDLHRDLELVDALAAATGDEVAVVFDGRDRDLRAERVEVAFAAHADDAIAARAAPGLIVVTSDRELAARAHAGGAEVVGARSLLARLG